MPLQNKSKFFVKSNKIKNITIPFLFILTFLLVLFNKTDYFLIYKIKSTGIEIIGPISNAISYPLRTTFNTINTINDLRVSSRENIKLKEEIIRLKKWQSLALKNITENNAYKKLLNSTANDLNIIKTAAVTHYSPELYTKSIIVNAGFDNQLDKNFPVINERGLVGKIIFVTKNNSKVLLITDQNSSVPVRSMNREFYAVMTGSKDGKYLISSFIKDNKKPLIGEILITSGRVDIYPKNII